MRTTIDLEPDTLMAAEALARPADVRLGTAVSRLLRMALTGQVGQTAAAAPVVAASATGFVPFAPRGVVVSNELIDKLRDSEGV